MNTIDYIGKRLTVSETRTRNLCGGLLRNISGETEDGLLRGIPFRLNLAMFTFKKNLPILKKSNLDSSSG